MAHHIGHSSPPLAIDYDRCHACPDCFARRKCRGGAFRVIDKGEPPVLDTSNCWGCLLCVIACPHGAIVRTDTLNTT